MQQTIASDEIQGWIWEGAGGAHSPPPYFPLCNKTGILYPNLFASPVSYAIP